MTKFAFVIWQLVVDCTYSIQRRCIWALAGTVIFLFGYILLFKEIILASFPVSIFFDAVQYVSWLALLFSFFIYVIFKSHGLFFFSILGLVLILMFFSSGNDWVSVSLVDLFTAKSFWSFFHHMMQAIALVLLGAAGIVAQVSLVSKRKLIGLLHYCLYWGTLCLFLMILSGELWQQAGGAKILEWGSSESWSLMTLCFYSALLYLGNYKNEENKLFLLGACIGMIFGFAIEVQRICCLAFVR